MLILSLSMPVSKEEHTALRKCTYGIQVSLVKKRWSQTVILKLEPDRLGFTMTKSSCFSNTLLKHFNIREVCHFRPGKYGLLCKKSSLQDRCCFSIQTITGKTFYFKGGVQEIRDWVLTGNYLLSMEQSRKWLRFDHKKPNLSP